MDKRICSKGCITVCKSGQESLQNFCYWARVKSIRVWQTAVNGCGHFNWEVYIECSQGVKLKKFRNDGKRKGTGND